MKVRDRAPAPAQAGKKDKSMTRMAQKMKEWFDQL
jgi:hypothetical protein